MPMTKIIWLELVSLMRSWSLPLLAAAAVGWTFAARHFVRGDGTAAGDRTILIGYALGGVSALVFIALAAAAAGSVSKERAAKRLQLTLLRPVSAFAVAFGRILALTAAGSLVFALALAAVLLSVPDEPVCRHVLHPVMESPREEAERMYAEYMLDPATPDEVKRAKKSAVLAILEQKAVDRYDLLPTNAVSSWSFRLPPLADASLPMWVRIRFSDSFSRKQEVLGAFRFRDRGAAVSNLTQSVNVFPLLPVGTPAAERKGEAEVLSFANRGEANLMLRPRRDVELLIAADSRTMNSVRCWLELTALMMAVVAFGVFLGTALSRPVAVWTVLVTLLLSVASPAVVEQYPLELEMPKDDAIALVLSRAVDTVTKPLNAFAPVTRFAENECIEWTEVGAAVGLDALMLSVLFSLLSILVLKRKKID